MKKLLLSMVSFTTLFSFVFTLTFTSSISSNLSAQEVKSGEKGSISIGDLDLSLEEAIKLVLKNSLTLRKEIYNVLMSDTAYRNFLSRYALTIEGDVAYTNQQMPESGMTSTFGGANSTEMKATIALQKLFATGTMVRAGITETLSDSDDKAISGFSSKDPAYHKPVFFIVVQQELLKNAFGFHELTNQKKMKTEAQMARESLINQLASVVINALADYWAVVVAKGSLTNAKLAVSSTRNLRNIVARNIKLGLSEKYELSFQNASLAQAESRLEVVNRELIVATRKLLRTINLPPETKIEGVTELVDVLPELDPEKALETAFRKRVDYDNALKKIEMARLNLQMSKNNALPSIVGFFELSTMGQDKNFGTAFGDTLGATYPTWSVGVRVSYPLGDTSAATKIRNADYELKQARLELEQLQKVLRDDVLDALDKVRTQHNVLIKTRKYRKEAERYYSRILSQARKGRFGTARVKDALDLMIASRQSELVELVNFNIDLLMFDLAKNEVFERYKINIEELLSEVK
ncbi:MAG: TolC family protein [Leptospirales bacterium]